VSDEIQAGLGRTGEMWGVDHLDLEPDVMTCAKGLRVGATVSRSDVFPEDQSRIASTWSGGDIINSLQGYLTLEAIREQNLLENVRTQGDRLVEQLADADPAGAEDIRGRGLMIGVEFESKEQRDAVHEAAFERGLLTLGCGYKTLRLLPPLDVTEREIDLGADLLLDAIADTVPASAA
jgi:4-aminobutyrate aminotransferase